jgi:hypothetical protein
MSLRERTIEKYLLQLPKKCRSKAILNYIEYNPPYKEVIGRMPTNVIEALRTAFIWSESPEGGAYWYDIAVELSGEGKKPEEGEHTVYYIIPEGGINYDTNTHLPADELNGKRFICTVRGYTKPIHILWDSSAGGFKTSYDVLLDVEFWSKI